MYEVINNFLITGDKFMPEMHLKQPGFTYSVYIYQNEIDKACFQHDMAYGDFKDLTYYLRKFKKKKSILIFYRQYLGC